MSSAQGPSLLNRLVARRRSQVSTLQLEAYRRAGSSVYELSLLADARRHELRAAGTHPWDADPSSASLFLCAWNASVHQALACELLDADVRDDPITRGFVPSISYRQVWSLFGPVQDWLSRGHRAAVSSDVWVGDEVDLPVSLPPLLTPRAAAPTFVRGMLTAGDVLHRLLEQALGEVLAAGDPPAQHAPALARITELTAQAHTALRYAPGPVAPAHHARAGRRGARPRPAGPGAGAPPRAVPGAAGAGRALPRVGVGAPLDRAPSRAGAG